jgi:hypothetical protein
MAATAFLASRVHFAKSGIQIPLHARPVRELMIPLAQRLLGKRPVHVIKLRQTCGASGKLDQFPAGSRKLVAQDANEHPGTAHLGAGRIRFTRYESG